MALSMTPRRSDSKKWTTVPEEFVNQIQTTLKDILKDTLKDTLKNEIVSKKIVTEGKIFQNEVLFRIGFAAHGQLKQSNFELSFDIPQERDQVLPLLHTGIDMVYAIIHEFFELTKNDTKNSKDEHDQHDQSELNIDLPYQWKPIEYNNNTFYFQFSTVNSELEEMANKLLGEEFLMEEADFNSPEMIKEKTFSMTEDALNNSEFLPSEELTNIQEKKGYLH